MSVILNKEFIVCFLVGVFLNIKIYAQNLIGIATYEKTYDSLVIISSKTNKDKYGFLEDKIRDATKSAGFKLEFNRSKSTFQMFKTMDSENSSLDSRASVLIGGGKGLYFLDTERDLRIHQVEAYGKTFLIESKLIEQKWKLTKETKYIDKYLCYKAIFIIEFDEKKKNKVTKDVIAWYTNDIPINLGPIGFSGLPGLILELHYGNTKYTCTNISFIDEIEIIEPKKGQRVSEPTFELISKRILDSLKKGK